LEWGKDDVREWLGFVEEGEWLQYFDAIRNPTGRTLAARSLERLAKPVGDETVAADLFTAVGLVLKEHKRRFEINDATFADIMEARGTCPLY
jgi:hypothetical protein